MIAAIPLIAKITIMGTAITATVTYNRYKMIDDQTPVHQ